MRRLGATLAVTMGLWGAGVAIPQPVSADTLYVDATYDVDDSVKDQLYQGAQLYDESDERNWAVRDSFSDPDGTALTAHHATTDYRPWKATLGTFQVSGEKAVPQGSTRAESLAYTQLPSVAPMDLFAKVDVGPDTVSPRLLFRATINTATDQITPGTGSGINTFKYMYVELKRSADLVVLHQVMAWPSVNPPSDWTMASAAFTDWGSGPIDVHVIATKTGTVVKLNGVDTLSFSGSAASYAKNTGIGISGSNDDAFDDVKVWYPLSYDKYSPSLGASPRAGVVVVHGGSFSDGDKRDIGQNDANQQTIINLNQEFASRGFNTYSINYRTRLKAEVATQLHPNTDSLTTTSAEPWSLTVTPAGGTSTQVDFTSGTATAAQVQSQLDEVVPGTRAVGGPLGVAPVTVTWPTPAPSAVAAAGSAVLAARPANILRQFESTPACSGGPPWNVVLTGGGCAGVKLAELYRCVSINGGAFPPAPGLCDDGLVSFAQWAVQSATFDAQSAIRFLKANDATLNANQLFITGESAGGIAALGVAVLPEEPEATRPNYSPGTGPTAVVAGAMPYSGGWLPNGMTPLNSATTPISLSQFDIDSASYFPGTLQTLVASTVGGLTTAGRSIGYDGLCGTGHGVPKSSPNWDAMIDGMVQFVHPLIDANSTYAKRAGFWVGNTVLNAITKQRGRNLLAPSGRDFVPLTGDFDGDLKQDVYWADTSAGATCGAVWLGRGDGTFQPAPVTNVDRFPVPAPSPAELAIPVPPTNGTPLVADFDADGASDIFWYSGTASEVWWGGESVLIGNHLHVFDEQAVTLPDTYGRVFTGNFGRGHSLDPGTRGDGADLYFLDQAGTGTDVLWYGAAGATAREFTVADLGSGMTTAQTPLVGNFNGDTNTEAPKRYDDIYWYGPGAITDGMWWGQANTGGLAAGAFEVQPLTNTLTYAQAIVGNFGKGSTTSGDGDDIYFFELASGWPYTGWDTLHYGSGAKTFEAVSQYHGFVATPGVAPMAVVANLDGDTDAATWDDTGWDDIVWYDPGSDNDRLFYGTRNDVPAAGTGFTRYATAIGEFTAPNGNGPAYSVATADFTDDGAADILWHRKNL